MTDIESCELYHRTLVLIRGGDTGTGGESTLEHLFYDTTHIFIDLTYQRSHGIMPHYTLRKLSGNSQVAHRQLSGFFEGRFVKSLSVPVYNIHQKISVISPPI